MSARTLESNRLRTDDLGGGCYLPFAENADRDRDTEGAALGCPASLRS